VADLVIDGSDLLVHLSTFEKAEAVHGNIALPLSAVVSVDAVESAWPHLRGMRAPGTGIPNVVAVGTRRGSFGKDFAAVHGTGAAVVVELDGADYQRIVVTHDDAVALAGTINAARTSG
jgi:hypothetical protein